MNIIRSLKITCPTIQRASELCHVVNLRSITQGPLKSVCCLLLSGRMSLHESKVLSVLFSSFLGICVYIIIILWNVFCSHLNLSHSFCEDASESSSTCEHSILRRLSFVDITGFPSTAQLSLTPSNATFPTSKLEAKRTKASMGNEQDIPLLDQLIHWCCHSASQHQPQLIFQVWAFGKLWHGFCSGVRADRPHSRKRLLITLGMQQRFQKRSMDSKCKFHRLCDWHNSAMAHLDQISHAVPDIPLPWL